MDKTQASVFEFLEQPSTHRGETVRRIDTHAAAVFLAGDRALKVKRAVSFPFLDYSTLDKRRTACIAELEVNRRFAPQLYRRVVPITRELSEDLALDGLGKVVEWAVEMHRFDESQTLDCLADRGVLDSRMAEKLAAMTLAMHQSAQFADVVQWLSAVESYIGQNTEAFRAYPALFSEAALVQLEGSLRHELERLRPLLVERGRQGFIRQGHGDLHLGNIAVVNGAPVAFDAIEFNPVVASGDVLYDLGFLLMDLIERRQVAKANIVLNGYFGSSGSLEALDGLSALAFFMSLRAAIRAKVTAARIGQDKCNDAALRTSARRYFDLALQLLQPVEPLLIGIGGLSGVGKSVIAKGLAGFVKPLPGALVLRSDVTRKHMFRCPETEPLPPEAYRSDVSTRVYAELQERAIRTVRAGLSVIVDATFMNADARSRVESAALNVEVVFVGIFLTADLETRVARIKHRGPDASDADMKLATKQEGCQLGELTWTRVDASGSVDQTLERSRAVILSHGTRTAAP